jgi:hypothetical protein
MSYVSPFVKDILDKCIVEFKKKDTKDKVNKYIIDPIIGEVGSRISPFAILFIITQVLIIVLLVYLTILVRNKD